MGNTDSLDGGDGADTANLEINTDIANTFTTTSVETVNVTSFGAHSISMKKMTGVETINSVGSTGALTLNDVASATMGVGVSGESAQTVDVNYTAGTLSGVADTFAATLTNVKDASLTVDAGFESVALTSTGTSKLSTLTVPGATSASVANSGTLTLADGVLDNVTTVTMTGSGDVKVGTFTGIKTFSAAAVTGAVTVAATNATTGAAEDSITGVAAGSTITTGAGADHIDFVSAASAAKVDTVKTGAGDDTVEVTINNGYLALFAEAGDDAITTGSSDANDYIDGGVGTDTLTLSGANAAVIRNVENVVLNASASLDATNATGALAVTAKTDTNGSSATAVSATNLTAGSTVTIDDSSAVNTDGATTITVGYAAAEATATVDVNVDVNEGTSAITVSKVDALTLDLAKAVDLGSQDLTIDDTTALTISAVKAVDLGAGISSAATDKLASITATGADAVDLGAIENSDKLATVSVTAGKAATVGNIVAAKALTDVTVTAGGATAATVGNIGSSTAADAITAVTVTGGTRAAASDTSVSVGTIAAKDSIGDITATSAKGTVTLGAISVDNTADTGSIGTVTATATDGSLTAGAITSDASLGTVSLTSTASDINAGDITAADATGITVDMTAKTAIDDGSNAAHASAAAITVTNSKGGITATLGGAADAKIAYVAGGGAAATAGVVNLTASNTGSSNIRVDNNAVSGDGATSTLNLGNASATTSEANTLTVEGTVDTLNVNGGTGADTLQFDNDVNVILGGTFSMGAGVDTVDFTYFDATGDNKSTHTGLVINLGSTAVTFDEGETYASTVAALKVAQYDDDAAASVANVDAKGSMFTLLGVEGVVGSANADYIVANATGTTITGGAGADIILGGAGVDTFVFGADATANGSDTITGVVGAGGDVLDFDAFLSTVSVANALSEGVYTAITGANAGVATASRNDAADDIVLIKAGTALTEYDTAAEVAALFTTVDTEEGGALSLGMDGKSVVIVAANDATQALVYFVSNDETAAVAEGEVALVGTMTMNADGIDAFVASNFGL